MSHDKLIHEANHIGLFFNHQPDEQAIAAINEHIRKFWDPRMRAQIIAEVDTAPLSPRVKRAVELLKTTK